MITIIIYNIILVIALSAIHSLVLRRFNIDTIYKQIITGLIFGLMVILLISNANQPEEGVYIDSRSIILIISGVFGGTIAALVTFVTGSIYRIYLGGSGLYTGLMLMALAVLGGIVFGKLRKRFSKLSSWWGFLALGLIVHVPIILTFYLLPSNIRHYLILALYPSLLVVYPVSTMLASLFYLYQEEERIMIQKLAQSENRFKNIFNGTRAILILVEPETGRIVDANKSAIKFYGWNREEFLKMKITQINTLPENEVKKNMELAKQNSQIYFEFKHHTASGVVRDVQVYTGPVEFDNEILLLSVILDMGDISMYREKLDIERNLLKTVIDNIPDAICVKDLSRRKILTNRAEIELLNKKESNIIGKTDYDLYPEDIAKEFEAEDRKVVDSGISIINKERKLSISGKGKVWMLTTKVPFRDHNGLIIGTIGIGRDITDRVKDISELKRAKEIAENATRSKSEFLANMSHEIRTPMNAILGFSEMLYLQISQPEQKKMLDGVMSSGKMLMRLLNDILDLSKIESGKQEIKLRSDNIVTLIKDIETQFRLVAENKGLEFIVEIPLDIPKVLKIDSIRLKQVLFNLVGNAVKFTITGFVKVGLRCINFDDSKVDLTLFVEDSGIGIDKSEFKNIFIPFQQIEKSSVKRYSGTGLGLSISKRLIEMMNGKISVESEPGKGTIFYVSIPQIELSKSKEIAKNSIPEKQINRIKIENSTILIVDDSETNRVLLNHIIKSAGFDCIVAEDGKEALEMLKSKIPDLIMLDILMPGIDGFEVAKNIREGNSTKNIPIIAFTAYVHNKEKLEKSGLFDAILHKPASQDEIISTVSNFFIQSLISDDSEVNNPEEMSAVKAEDIITLTPDKIINLNALIRELEGSYLTNWNKLQGQLVLFKIKSFALNLSNFANENNIPIIKSYSKELLSNIETINIKKIKSILSKFPEIINDLKKLTE